MREPLPVALPQRGLAREQVPGHQLEVLEVERRARALELGVPDTEATQQPVEERVHPDGHTTSTAPRNAASASPYATHTGVDSAAPLPPGSLSPSRSRGPRLRDREQPSRGRPLERLDDLRARLSHLAELVSAATAARHSAPRRASRSGPGGSGGNAGAVCPRERSSP